MNNVIRLFSQSMTTGIPAGLLYRLFSLGLVGYEVFSEIRQKDNATLLFGHIFITNWYSSLSIYYLNQTHHL